MALRVGNLNFVTSPSGILVPEITDNPSLGDGAADVTFDIIPGTTDGWVLTTDAGEAVWAPPSSGGGVDSIEAEGGGQLTGDVTFSEGTDITLTTVGNDIEIASSGASGIPDTIFDAKGDLIAASAADTAARLGPIGSNGTILTADSAESTGMKWASPSGGGVTLLNYTAITSPVTVSGTSGAQTTLITASSSITVGGSTEICAEVYFPKIAPAANDLIIVTLWDSAELGQLLTMSAATIAPQIPIFVRRYFTPSAGTYTYAVKAYRITTNGTATAGAGGAGNSMPAYLRLTSGS